jgi:hypothetical protein
MEKKMNLEELEEEALEVNRRYMNYQALRQQHRERVIAAFDETFDPEDIKKLVNILMVTTRKEEGE